MQHPGSLWGKTNVIVVSVIVVFLFVWESKECALAVCRTNATQTHTTQFQHYSNCFVFPSKKPRCTAQR